MSWTSRGRVLCRVAWFREKQDGHRILHEEEGGIFLKSHSHDVVRGGQCERCSPCMRDIHGHMLVSLVQPRLALSKPSGRFR